MEETDDEPPSPSSLSTPSSIKKKLKSTFSTFNFRKQHHHGQHRHHVPPEWQDSSMSSITAGDHQEIIIMRPSQSPNDNHIAHDDLDPMVYCRRRNMIMSCIRPRGPKGHRRRHTFSGDQFKYDALSYSLNFDEGLGDPVAQQCGGTQDHHLNTFASRLPPSPNNRPRRWHIDHIIPV